MHYFWQSKERLTNKYLPISPSVSRREGANSARRSAARPLLTPVQALPLLMVAPVSPELGPLTTATPYLATTWPQLCHFMSPGQPAAAALARQSRIWWLRPNLERIHICHEHYIRRTHLLAEIENRNFIWNKYILNCIAYELTRKMLIESLIKSQMYILEMLTSCGGWR